MNLHNADRLWTAGLAVGAGLALAAAAAADRPKPNAPQGGLAGSACSCPADFNLDGMVDGADLAAMLGGWNGSAYDVTGDGVVNGADIGALLGTWGPCFAPSNDDCGGAILVGGGTDVAFCTTWATELQQSLGGQCGAFATNIYNDVWYTFVPEGDGELTLSTCGTAEFDTIIAVYTSPIPGLNACPPVDGGVGTSSLIACNDDTDECGGGVLQSKLTVDVVGGKSYKIRLGGFNGASGSGELQVDFKSVGALCFDGIVVTGDDGQTAVVTGTTVDNYETFPPCTPFSSPGEWVTYYCTCEHQNVELSTCHPETDFDTVLTVYRESVSQGCDGILIECVDDTESAACLLNGFHRKSKASFTAQYGEVYHILISGYSETAKGNFKLTVETDCF